MISPTESRFGSQFRYLEDEALADLPGGVVSGVLVLGEIPSSHEGDGDGVAKHHLNRGGGNRSEVERTELALEREVDMHIAEGGEGGGEDGGEGDEASAFGSGAWDQSEELVGGAGFAEEDEDVAVGEDADVAVEGVEGVEEGGADAEGDEGLGDFVGDEAGFADAGEEDGARRVEEGAGEGEGLGVVDVGEEVVEVVLLGFEEI